MPPYPEKILFAGTFSVKIVLYFFMVREDAAFQYRDL